MQDDELLDEYIEYAFRDIKDIIREEERKYIANTLGFAVYKLKAEWRGFVKTLSKSMQIILEILSPTDEEYQFSSKEIRQQLKHEKNQMRIKQLNRELNKAYKRERGKK